MEAGMVFTQADAETLQHILRWRRDVRHFRPDPVDEAVLERLRAAMDYVPSVGNSRPWRVIRVTDKALRDTVRADFLRCNAEAAASYPPELRAAYLALKLAGLDRAPVQLAIFTSIDPAEGHGLGRQTLPQTLRQSTAMAVQTLWLAARVENLGLGLVSILDPSAMERLFAVPPEWEWATYICLGHPEQSDDTPLLHRAGWQDNTRTVWEER